MRAARLCKGCQKPVAFVIMRGGRRGVEHGGGRPMPVDPEIMRTWMIEPAKGQRANLTLVTIDGQLRQGIEVAVTHPGSTAVEGYVPHWATCARAAEFRR